MIYVTYPMKIRQHKILTRTLLILFIINFALAAPVAVRERPEVRLGANVKTDVSAAPQKRWDPLDEGGSTGVPRAGYALLPSAPPSGTPLPSLDSTDWGQGVSTELSLRPPVLGQSVPTELSLRPPVSGQSASTELSLLPPGAPPQRVPVIRPQPLRLQPPSAPPLRVPAIRPRPLRLQPPSAPQLRPRPLRPLLPRPLPFRPPPRPLPFRPPPRRPGPPRRRPLRPLRPSRLRPQSLDSTDLSQTLRLELSTPSAKTSFSPERPGSSTGNALLSLGPPTTGSRLPVESMPVAGSLTFPSPSSHSGPSQPGPSEDHFPRPPGFSENSDASSSTGYQPSPGVNPETHSVPNSGNLPPESWIDIWNEVPSEVKDDFLKGKIKPRIFDSDTVLEGPKIIEGRESAMSIQDGNFDETKSF